MPATLQAHPPHPIATTTLPHPAPNPQGPTTAQRRPGGGIHVREPANISTAEYHEIADAYIDELVAALEEKAETPGSGYDVEFSGTYVLNKQPPNRQIWISSPMSGPKRYDWVWMQGEGQDQKEGTGMDVEGDLRGGQWVYLRDGATLSDLLKKELDVQMNPSEDVGGAP
ncbi:hypothetical protein EPUS_07367 [Endocarpon pusillum Z07020]|uniref:Ferroxidase n=1 Tax=Endocarpon pusillum (strain Z07020 / HMAS-L-300199) TaxID=1263415 RepID=U1HJT3_ENDPU|nr:uncharacterized protein EPUS_07367 [Endocarpon pusillum Z07020]ERF70510.1 hypothetical protein EPUS_07367 [Endocarpon pusillum Z07020]